MDIALKFALVFVATFILDWIWASYIIETSSKNSVRASVLSGLLVLMGGFVTLSYVEDTRMLAAAALGGMLGTFLSVERSRKDEEDS